MQRRRVDEALIWQLMRFPDEPEAKGSGGAFETKNETTSPTGGRSGGGADHPTDEENPA
jgi:hypothetical protein